MGLEKDNPLASDPGGESAAQIAWVYATARDTADIISGKGLIDEILAMGTVRAP